MRRYTLFKSETNGGVALIFGLVIPSLIGFTGLAADGAYWMMSRNKLQATTDSAAIAAAKALNLEGPNGQLTAAAGKLFTKAYSASDPTLTYQVVSPPTTGAFAGDASAVSVTSRRTQPIFFLSMFGMENVSVASRAVSKVEDLTEACVLALSPTVDKALEIAGSAAVALGCGVASNSTAQNSIYVFGSSSLSTTGASSAGDVYVANANSINTSGGPIKTYSQPLDDPYGPKGRNLQVPDNPKKCKANNLKVMADTALEPGRYCGGISFQKGTTTLSPGTYLIDGGDFDVGAQTALVGEGVTIILTGSGNKYAEMKINGGAALDLKAPESGTATDGVLFFQDPNAPTYQGNQIISNKLNGNADMKLQGAVYFPSQEVEFTGGANAQTSCLQLVSFKIKISGNSAITNTCPADAGTESIARSTVQLVE